VAQDIERGLRALGMTVIPVATPYDAVSEAARREGAVDRLIVGVDYFGPEAFRVLPLFRREWPDTTLVAYHSPGFEHKGHIAELVGADLVVAGSNDLSRLLQTVAAARRSLSPAAAASARPSPAPASHGPAGTDTGRPPSMEVAAALARPAQRPTSPPPKGRPPAEASWPEAMASDARADPHPAFSEALRQGCTAGKADGSVRVGASTVVKDDAPSTPPAPRPGQPERAPSRAAANPQDAPPKPSAETPLDGADIDNLDGNDNLAHGRVLGTVELTEEELRLLLGEDDDQ